eukprot:6298553-Prymnesium_polylepis.1
MDTCVPMPHPGNANGAMVSSFADADSEGGGAMRPGEVRERAGSARRSQCGGGGGACGDAKSVRGTLCLCLWIGPDRCATLQPYPARVGPGTTRPGSGPKEARGWAGVSSIKIEILLSATVPAWPLTLRRDSSFSNF